MSKKINVYDLNNPYYLYEDIEHTIDKIGELFEVVFLQSKIEFISRINFPEDAFWFSDEVTKIFNEKIPVIKGIIKDIYAAIEGLYVAKNGVFNKALLEKKYPDLKILREFNNKLKHHNTRNVTFHVVSIVNIQVKTLDCIIQYQYGAGTPIQMIPLAQLFALFFLILEDENIVTIDRK